MGEEEVEEGVDVGEAPVQTGAEVEAPPREAAVACQEEEATSLLEYEFHASFFYDKKLF